MQYDPLSLPEDKKTVPGLYPITAQLTDDSTGLLDTVRILPQHYDDIDSSSSLYSRYRIQLYSTNIYGAAQREARIAGEVFDQKIYLDYEVPYYKVRVGDFVNRLVAEDYLPAAKQAGYSTAWVVKVAIDIKTLEDIYTDDEIPDMHDIPDSPDDSTYLEPEPSNEFDTDSENQ